MVTFNLASKIEKAIKNEKINNKKKQVSSKKNNGEKKSSSFGINASTNMNSNIIAQHKPVLLKTIMQLPSDDNKDNQSSSSDVKVVAEKQPEKRNSKKTVMKKHIEKVVNDTTQSNELTHIRVNDIYIDENESDLREEILAYLKSTVAFSQDLYARDVEKAKQHRFIITGLHETLHYVKYNKAQFVCIAEDIIEMDKTREIVDMIVRYCKENSILIVQCFKKRRIARIFKRGQSMSCICIIKDSFTITKEFKALEVALCSFSYHKQ